MWTKSLVQDACSPVVALIIQDKIVWCMKQVCLYAVVTLLVTIAILTLIPKVLKKYGYEW